jgi:hypothetical protein
VVNVNSETKMLYCKTTVTNDKNALFLKPLCLKCVIIDGDGRSRRLLPNTKNASGTYPFPYSMGN